MTDTITIVRSCDGKRLAKLIGPGSTIADYDHSYFVDLIVHPVAYLGQLFCLLGKLLHRPDCAVVRGAVADQARVTAVRRLVHHDRKTGDEPTLHDVPRQWLALDIEGVERPASVAASDLVACAEIAIQKLPAAFHRAGCVVQATAGHGIKPGYRLRLWYWLTRPTTSTELSLWMRRAPADAAVFRPAQLIYTAAPLFEGGVADRLAVRLAKLSGTAAVAVPSPDELQPPPRKRYVPVTRPGETLASRYAFAALTNAAVRVGQAPNGQRHSAVLREARGLSRLITAGLLSESDVSHVLHGAGASAGLVP